MKKLTRQLLLHGLLSLFATTTLFAQESEDSVVVIVSAQQGVEALSLQQIEDLFLGRNYSFPDGSPAIPVDHTENSVLRLRFYQDILGRNAAQMRSHWARQVFTGRGRPPQTVASADELLQLIREDVRIVSYLGKSSLTLDTKVVLE